MALGSTSTAAYYWKYRTTDVAENLSKSLFGVQRIPQRKNFEVILTVNMETRHSVGESFGFQFSAFVIIAEL